MDALPMFPLEWVLFPGEELRLQIFEPRYRVLVTELMRTTERRFGVVLISRGREVGGGEQRCDVGTMTTITDCGELDAGRYLLRCMTGERLRVLEWLPDNPYPVATAQLWPDEPDSGISERDFRGIEDRIVALNERIAIARGARFLPGRNAMLGIRRRRSLPPGQRLYSLASRVPMSEADRYAVLAAPTVTKRLAALADAVETVAAKVEFSL